MTDIYVSVWIKALNYLKKSQWKTACSEKKLKKESSPQGNDQYRKRVCTLCICRSWNNMEMGANPRSTSSITEKWTVYNSNTMGGKTESKYFQKAKETSGNWTELSINKSELKNCKMHFTIIRRSMWLKKQFFPVVIEM